MKKRKLITFDWALKRLLRSKVNFEILEGFLSELLGDDIHILEVLESESNKVTEKDKYNRVDLKVRNQKDELIIIEVYNTKGNLITCNAYFMAPPGLSLSISMKVILTQRLSRSSR